MVRKAPGAWIEELGLGLDAEPADEWGMVCRL